MKNAIHAALTASLAVALVAAVLAEIRWHVFERFVGAYMDARNDSRDRLERFVDQESRTSQALEKANELVELRSLVALDAEEGPGRPDAGFASPSDVVRLEHGHKLIMTRDRFLAMPEWLTGADPSFAGRADSLSRPQSAFEPDSLTAWTRTVVIRPGWIRRGEAYLVDDDNYILHRMPISTTQFDLIDAYASASEGRIHEDMEYVYEAGAFFDTLRSLDMEMRDEIIDPIRFRDLEKTAQRVGVSENRRIIQIERLVDGQIAVVTIPVSADLFTDLYVALGAL